MNNLLILKFWRNGFLSDIFVSNEERQLKDELKQKKILYLRKSDKEYISELTVWVCKRINANPNIVRSALRTSSEVRELIRAFKEKVKNIDLIDGIRKEKLELEQSVKAFVEKKLQIQ